MQAVSHAEFSWEALAVVIGLLALLAAAAAAAARLRRSLSVARRWSTRLEQLIDAVPDEGLLLLDAAGMVLHSNAAAQRLHGYAEREMAGQHFALLFTNEERQARAPENQLEAAVRQGSAVTRGARLQRDGRTVTIETQLTALRNEADGLAGFSVVERDVSEQLGQKQALAEARASLASVQKLAALGRLGEGMAHEFNNVVHVIKTSVALLQRRTAVDEQAAGLLQMIKRNADRAAELSHHLVALARGRPPNPVATDVNEIVATVVALLRVTLNENIVIEQELDDALCWVTIDRSELEAALLHLAANARDAMRAGGRLAFRTAQVRQPAAPETGQSARPCVLISVRDTAADMASSEARGAAPGAALGGTAESELGTEESAAARARADESNLELVRGLLVHSSGQLQVERRGSGLTVNLYLPCRDS